MTTFNLIVLRVLMYTVGRFYPDLVRQLLQKLLITGKKAAPLQFSRRFTWRGEELQLERRAPYRGVGRKCAPPASAPRKPPSTW